MRKLFIAILLLSTTAIYAESAEQRGLEIAIESEQRDKGWQDQKSNLVMILSNKQGQKSHRKMHNRAFEMQNDGDKTMIIFDQPHDVKGTAFLTYTHSKRQDDQWLYLPALKRIKRISSNNKSGPFMGSEFAYEDLASQEVDKYTYKYLQDEKFNGRDVFVLERYPTYKHSGYTKQVVYMDKQMYQPLKVVFYDRKSSILKTLLFEEYHLHIDKYWRATKMRMLNQQNGKSTDLIWENIQFRNGFTEKDFNKNSLKRAR